MTLKTIKEKLEIDNPKRYVDGYYQLSKKQKQLWVLGLFLIGVIFFCIKSLFLDGHISFITKIVASFVSSLLITILSFFVAFCLFCSIRIANKITDKMQLKSILKINQSVFLYQAWTIFLILIIIAIIFKIPLHYISPLLNLQ